MGNVFAKNFVDGISMVDIQSVLKDGNGKVFTIILTYKVGVTRQNVGTHVQTDS